MNGVSWSNLAHVFRRMTLPLMSYYAVTLALPLANGAAQSGTAFVKHALVVLAGPPVLIALACVASTAARAGLAHCMSVFVRRVRPLPGPDRT